MEPSPRPRLFLRLVPVLAFLFSLIVAVGPVAAADPTVVANPALVPFDTTPGKPGTTTLTFTANGTTGLSACGQDNAQPPFKLGAVSATTPLVLPFPFIQAGKYTFWVSTDAGCAGAKLATATSTRLGPTGKAGVDDIQFRLTGQKNFFTLAPSGTSVELSTGIDISLLGLITSGTSPEIQPFPIPGVQLCIMSGDGAQVDIAMKVGQDIRSDKGLGPTAATTTVQPISGQNGCYDIPWVVNGGYNAAITRSGANYSFGFCVITSSAFNKPSVSPTANTKCAQVADFPRDDVSLAAGTEINGSIVTGVDNHAVQVCVSAFTPNPIGVPDVTLKNTVNAYNQSGAVNLTPLKLNFPANTVTRVTTYDITGPGPGGTVGAQFICPAATATQAGPAGQVTAINVPPVAGATIIDNKSYKVSG